ncbi:MAG: hypothetical protein ACHQK9_12810 [Reyranellales bacterium]
MKRAAFGLLIAGLAAGCGVPGEKFDQMHAGMNREEVVSLVGPPETSIRDSDRDCDIYRVTKDFWSRVPWDMSWRYQVCFSDGKVQSFGRTDTAR